MKVAWLLAGMALAGCGKVLDTPVDTGTPLPDDMPTPDGPPPPEPVEVEVSGTNSSNHTCARISDGRVFCWGANTIGQLGFPPAPLDTVPPGEVVLTGTSPARLVVAKSGQADGIAFACVQDAAGTASCWGSNFAGELARGTFDTIPHPQALPIEGTPNTPLAGIAQLALGGRHACVLVGTQVRCWGSDEIGCAVTGNADGAGNCLTASGALFTRPGAVTGVPASSRVAAGAAGNCAVTSTNDGVVCWGNNKFKTAGNPAVTTTGDAPPSATALTGVTGITQIVMGNAHACVVAAGHVHCWGQNNAGQIGATTGNIDQPFELTSLAGQTQLTAGGFNLCGYTPGNADGALVCLGANVDGQLGIGSADNLPHGTPASVGDLTDIASASISDHGCAVARLRTDPAGTPRRVFCWGRNNAGQVVQPPSTRVLDPVEVVLPL